MSKIDSGYVWTALTIKLECVPGKGIIGLLWSSLNVWRPSKFIFRVFLSVTPARLELWYHKAEIRAWQRSHRASSLNVWRLSNYFYLEVFYRWVEILNDAKDEFEVYGASAVFSTWSVEGEDPLDIGDI